MKKIKKAAFLSIMLIITILATISCKAEKISQNQLKLEQLSVAITDLPDGWIYSGQDWNQNFGAEDFTIGYGIPNNNIIRFAHTMSSYSDEEQARIGYSEWEKDTFSDGFLQTWEEADFSPSDPRDQYRFECEQILSDASIFSCVYLQRHNQIISDILVNLDGKAMTFAQLNEILGVLDKRLNEVNVENQ